MKIIIHVVGRDKPLVYTGPNFEIHWSREQVTLSNADEAGILSPDGDALERVQIERSGLLAVEEAL